jgi:hypothetical protein
MKVRDTIWALAVALVLCATIVHAQDQKQGSQSASPNSALPPLDLGVSGGPGKPPIGAARGISAANAPQPNDPAQVLPDTNTLAGAEPFGLGSLDSAHTIFDPSISFSELGQTFPPTPGQSSLASTTLLNGIMNFDRTWSKYHLSAAYTGGETFNLGPITSHTSFQNLMVMQQITWERWHVLLRDDFTASPGAAFTGAGMGGPGLIAQSSSMLGSLLNGSGQAFTPGETIETGNATRYMNSVLGQMEYSFSRRSTLTFSGSYGLLDFPSAGYVSSHMLNAQAGYDYLIDPMDSIGVIASYGKTDYTGATNSNTDYSASLAFGRKITGRLALQAGVGPQQTRVASGTGNFDLWFMSVNSALSYERRRSGVSFSYTRGLGAGAGVYLGAATNTFLGSGHYQFTRFWTGSVAGGYALNTSLAPAGVATTSFNNVFAGANLGRRVGRHAQINFNYGVQRQGSPAACPVANCGIAGIQQTFGMSVTWHLLRTE